MALEPVPHGGRARAALLTSASLAVSAAAAVALSTLFLRRYHASAASDGFFAAFSIYLVIVMFGGSLRIVGPAWCLRNKDGRGELLLDAVSSASIVLAVVLVAASPVASQLLATGRAQGHARTALLILGPSAALQLFGAAQSAALQVRGNYMRPALAISFGTLLAPLAFIVLAPLVGVAAMSLAYACNAVAAVAIQTVADGAIWRPRRVSLRAVSHAWLALVVGGAGVLSASIAYVVTVSLLHGAPTGTVTVLSYAYYIVSTIYLVTASSVAFVVAADDVRSGVQLVAPLRAALLGMAPLLAIASTGGAIAVAALFGLDHGRSQTLRNDVLLLVPWAPATGLLALAVAVLVARGRHRALVGGIAVALALHVVVSLVLRSALGIDGLVAALGIAPVAAALSALAIVRPERAWAGARSLVLALCVFGSAAGTAGLAGWAMLMATGDRFAWAVVASALAAAVYVSVMWVVRPPELARVRAALRRLDGTTAAP